MKALVPVLLLIGVAAARAEGGPPQARLAIDECVADDASLVREAVGLELGGRLAEGDAADRDVTRVAVSCRGSAVVIEVSEPRTRQTLTRTIEVAGLAGLDRARLLGLAIAEAVTASWAELDAPAAEPVVAADPVAPVVHRTRAVARAPARAESAVGLTVLATSRAFAGEPLLWGAGLGFALRPTEHVALEVGLGAEWASQPAGAGRVSTQLLSTAATLRGRLQVRGIELGGGLGFRVGRATLSGEAGEASYEASTVTAPWGGPFATLQASGRIAGPVRAALWAEAGLVTMAVVGKVSDADAVRLDGSWASVSLGLGVDL